MATYLPTITGNNVPIQRRFAENTAKFDVGYWLRKFYRRNELRPGRERDLLQRANRARFIGVRWDLEQRNKWSVKPDVISNYPLAGGKTLRVYEPIKQDHALYQRLRVPNSWYIAVAMVIYGDWRQHILVKAQIEKFFTIVIRDVTHPRYTLYRAINEITSGPNKFRLQDRLRIPYCDVHHGHIGQITADVFGICLYIYQQNGDKTDLQVRGLYNAPHKIIKYSRGYNKDGVWEEVYEPLSPELPQHTDMEFKFPKLPDNFVGNIPLPGYGIPEPLTFVGPMSVDGRDLQQAAGEIDLSTKGPREWIRGPQTWWLRDDT